MSEHLSVREQAFEAFPTPISILDAEGQVQHRNERWHSVAESTDSPVFATESNGNLRTALQASPRPSSALVDEVTSQLDDLSRPPTTIQNPFGDEFRDHHFLGVVTDFEHDGARYLILAFIDVRDVSPDDLGVREHATRLEAALQTISHDLRTPLSLAEGYAGLLASETDDPPEELTGIRSAVKRATQIIDDARALAQDQGSFDRERVDVASVARSVWEDIEQVRNGQSLVIEETVQIEAHRGLLTRVFENLFTNSIQHAGPEVTIRVGVLDEPGASTVGLSVEDDGPGLLDTGLGDPFEPGETAGENGGYGLGLTIVDTVVHAHGWSITATESEGSGVRFEITGIQPG